MNLKKSLVYFPIVVVMILNSCSQPATAPSSIEDVEIKEATLTFDGETCLYEGPEQITEGEFAITLISDSELEAEWWVYRIDDDKTWEDMVDYISPPGSVIQPPSWSSSVLKSTDPENPNTGIFKLQPGLYAINCCTCQEVVGTIGVWPGAPLEVIEGNK